MQSATYTAYDPEGGTVTFTLLGDDKDMFELGAGPDICPTDPSHTRAHRYYGDLQDPFVQVGSRTLKMPGDA